MNSVIRARAVWCLIHTCELELANAESIEVKKKNDPEVYSTKQIYMHLLYIGGEGDLSLVLRQVTEQTDLF